MWFIWMPVGLALLITKRYMQKQWKLMHTVHAILGCIVLYITFQESMNVYWHHKWLYKFAHNTIPDNTVSLLSVLVCFSGIYTQCIMAYYKGDKPWSKTEKITMIGKVHRYFGYVMLFVGNMACALGFANYIENFMGRKDVTNPGWVSLVIFCVTVFICEYIYRRVSRRSFMKLRTPETTGYKNMDKVIKFYTPMTLE